MATRSVVFTGGSEDAGQHTATPADWGWADSPSARQMRTDDRRRAACALRHRSAAVLALRVGWALASPRRCKRPASAVVVQFHPYPPIPRTWLNGRVPERHSGGVGSTPAVRASSHKQAWVADLVTAPR